MTRASKEARTIEPTHGDGRRMTLAEAVERRRRMAAFWGGVGDSPWHDARVGQQDRRWSGVDCELCNDHADEPEDVGLLDGVAVAMCVTCRGDDPAVALIEHSNGGEKR